MKKNEVIIILKLFFSWRIILFFIAFIAIYFLPNFGGRFPYYDTALEITKLPNWIWGFGNFDGVHYLRVAQNWYSDAYTQAFFPLYPILIKSLAIFIPKNTSLDLQSFVDPAYFLSGFVLSNIFFALGLLFLYKLFRLDFDKQVSFRSLVLLLVFPTAFYFGSVYTESLFLLLTVTSILLVRKRNFLFASIFILFAACTKIIGILLLVYYFYEILKSRISYKSALGLLIAPLGLLSYVYYLFIRTGDPIGFLTSQKAYGSEKLVQGIVLFPQVIYRYAKILYSVELGSTAFFNAFLELSFTLIAIGLLVWLFKKMDRGYWILTLLFLLVPTLSGTLSSMPRYVLFGFLMLPYVTKSLNTTAYKVVVLSSLVLGCMLLSLFIRGYWIA